MQNVVAHSCPVFLDQVGDDVLLVTVHPSGKRRQQYLQRLEIGSHAAILGDTTAGTTVDCVTAEFSDSTRPASCARAWRRMIQKSAAVSTDL